LGPGCARSSSASKPTVERHASNVSPRVELLAVRLRCGSSGPKVSVRVICPNSTPSQRTRTMIPTHAAASARSAARALRNGLRLNLTSPRPDTRGLSASSTRSTLTPFRRCDPRRPRLEVPRTPRGGVEVGRRAVQLERSLSDAEVRAESVVHRPELLRLVVLHGLDQRRPIFVATVMGSPALSRSSRTDASARSARRPYTSAFGRRTHAGILRSCQACHRRRPRRPCPSAPICHARADLETSRRSVRASCGHRAERMARHSTRVRAATPSAIRSPILRRSEIDDTTAGDVLGEASMTPERDSSLPETLGRSGLAAAIHLRHRGCALCRRLLGGSAVTTTASPRGRTLPRGRRLGAFGDGFEHIPPVLPRLRLPASQRPTESGLRLRLSASCRA